MTGNTGHPFAIGGPQIRVKVTEHDIAWATRSDSSRCMVAKAIARQVADASRIEVDTQTIRFSTVAKRYAYLTPLTVQNYVAAFDDGRAIEPFEFTLRNPMQLRRRLLSPEEKDLERHRRLTEDKARQAPVSRTAKAAKPPKRTQAKFTDEGRRAPPRVFKTHKRTYGARVLRINQPMQPTALDEAPA